MASSGCIAEESQAESAAERQGAQGEIDHSAARSPAVTLLSPRPGADPERAARMSKRNVDKGLVERVKAGDKHAFDMLVRKYQHKVVKLVSRYVNDQSEAYDVAQEAFIKAYRAMPSFRGDSAFYNLM
jgi:hypothetical protein